MKEQKKNKRNPLTMHKMHSLASQWISKNCFWWVAAWRSELFHKFLSDKFVKSYTNTAAEINVKDGIFFITEREGLFLATNIESNSMREFDWFGRNLNQQLNPVNTINTTSQYNFFKCFKTRKVNKLQTALKLSYEWELISSISDDKSTSEEIWYEQFSNGSYRFSWKPPQPIPILCFF